MRFSVQLDDFRGPLDLLLYLVRKHELDVVDIPLARVIDQYLQYIAVLEQIDVDAVGDFLDMASTLIEIKSRMVLPGGEEVEQGGEGRGGARRAAVTRAPGRAGPFQEPIHEGDLWYLVSASGRVLKEKLSAHGPQ